MRPRDFIRYQTYRSSNGLLVDHGFVASYAALIFLLLYPRQLEASLGSITINSADAWFIGEGLNEQMGWSVASAGDFNGDGFSDFLLGAPLNDQEAWDCGRAYLLFGGRGRFQGLFDLLDADGIFTGESSEDYAGSAISSAGDLDGDGFDDVLISAWGNDEGKGDGGKVYIIYGGLEPPGYVSLADVPAAFIGSGVGETAGSSLASAGDVNQDGFSDLLIGAPAADVAGNNAGRVYLVFGSATRFTGIRSLSTADVILEGESANDAFGTSVTGVSDVDGDGADDIAVGAPSADRGGRYVGAAYVFSGQSLTRGIHTAQEAVLTIVGSSEGEQAGYSLAPVGDYDGDARADVLVGAFRGSFSGRSNGAGILMLSSRVSLNTEVPTSEGIPIFGDDSYDGAGRSVASGDLDGDGMPDVVVAAPYAVVGGIESVGRVALVLWKEGDEQRSIATGDNLVGDAGSGLLGFSLASMLDVDSDGHDDLLVGAAGLGHSYLLFMGRYYDDDGDTFAEVTGDCDDEEILTFPGASEVPYDGIDQDCDGQDLQDVDGDGFTGTQVGGADCNDTDSSVFPTALELPDGVDQDCDGDVDEGTPNWDGDQDGYSPNQGDCDDTDDQVHPGASETANSRDDDCDGRIDEGLPTTDDDGDGLSDVEGDCDDSDAAIYPGAQENIGGPDANCDGLIESSLEPGDQDGDGFTEADGDEDDSDPSVYPGALDILDGLDNDSDGLTDEDALDQDADGFTPLEGDQDDLNPAVYPGSDIEVETLDQDGDGYSPLEGDCNDLNAAVSPASSEMMNGLDDDCDGAADEGTARYDDDRDGYSELEGDCDDEDPFRYPGAAEPDSSVDTNCDGSTGETPLDGDADGITQAEGDCNDSDGGVYPGALEAIDGVDNDCDGVKDEGTMVSDDDSDGYSELDGDCDDGDASFHPGASDPCDGIDQDCDPSSGDCGLETPSDTPTPPINVPTEGATEVPTEEPTPSESASPTPDDTTSTPYGRFMGRGGGCGCSSRAPLKNGFAELVFLTLALRPWRGRGKRRASLTRNP